MTGMTLTRGDSRRINSISISRRLPSAVLLLENLRVTSRLDKVEQSVNSVIPESGVSLDPRLLGQDIIILPLEIRRDLLEAAAQLCFKIQNSPVLVINTLSETRGIDNSQSDPGSILLQLDIVLFNTYRVFLVSPCCRVRNGVGVELRVQVQRVLVQRC
jgi:hypothetical protein